MAPAFVLHAVRIAEVAAAIRHAALHGADVDGAVRQRQRGLALHLAHSHALRAKAEARRVRRKAGFTSVSL
jgi:hypothetical protein